MTETRIFLSYRRSDASGHAGRLYDYLAGYFGGSRLFFDVDTIEAGVDFEKRIVSELDHLDAVLVLIGNQWLDVRDKQGKRRLDDPQDNVRLEVQMALEKNLQVIPVLLQGASMPASDALPEALCDLSLRNAVRLNDDHWKSDCQLLAGILQNVLHVPRSIKEQKIRKYRTIVFLWTALLTIGAMKYFGYGIDTLGPFYPVAVLIFKALFIAGAAHNVALVTYLLGKLKKDLDLLSTAIIGIAVLGIVLVAWDESYSIWLPLLMLLEAGLLNFVQPDE